MARIELKLPASVERGEGWATEKENEVVKLVIDTDKLTLTLKGDTLETMCFKLTIAMN